MGSAKALSTLKIVLNEGAPWDAAVKIYAAAPNCPDILRAVAARADFTAEHLLQSEERGLAEAAAMAGLFQKSSAAVWWGTVLAERGWVQCKDAYAASAKFYSLRVDPVFGSAVADTYLSLRQGTGWHATLKLAEKVPMGKEQLARTICSLAEILVGALDQARRCAKRHPKKYEGFACAPVDPNECPLLAAALGADRPNFRDNISQNIEKDLRRFVPILAAFVKEHGLAALNESAGLLKEETIWRLLAVEERLRFGAQRRAWRQRAKQDKMERSFREAVRDGALEKAQALRAEGCDFNLEDSLRVALQNRRIDLAEGLLRLRQGEDLDGLATATPAKLYPYTKIAAVIACARCGKDVSRFSLSDVCVALRQKGAFGEAAWAGKLELDFKRSQKATRRDVPPR